MQNDIHTIHSNNFNIHLTMKTKTPLIRRFLLIGIFLISLNQGNVFAQFIGADFNYKLDKTEKNDSLPMSMTNPGTLSFSSDPTLAVKYKVTLKLYFNCFHEDFHKQQPITIHESMANVQTAELNMDLDSVYSSTEYLNVSCEMAQEQCLKIATYSASVELKNLAGGYNITWGTGCWDFSVTNLDNLEMQGLAMVLHIPFSDDQKVNSSPIFTSLPQVLTCPQKIMNINSSAMDQDGDKLTYQLIHPFTYEQVNNLGNNKHDDIFPGQESYKPLIVGRPPFKQLKYALGYGFNNPFGKSAFSIDKETGSMNLEAAEAGKYLVGIGVSEYRNDIQLSQTQRIFLLEVLSEPKLMVQK